MWYVHRVHQNMEMDGESIRGRCPLGVVSGRCVLWYPSLVGGSVSLGDVRGSSGLGSAFSSSTFLCRFAVRVEGSCMGCIVLINGLHSGYELHKMLFCSN